MLNQAQKKQLRGLANSLDCLYQIGKDELKETQIEMLDKALTAHELIKISLLKTVPTPIKELAIELSLALHAEVVQVIGRVLVLYRKNRKNPRIRLVK